MFFLGFYSSQVPITLSEKLKEKLLSSGMDFFHVLWLYVSVLGEGIMSRSKCYHPFCPCSLFLQPVISLDGRISYTFTSKGMNTVMVQVSLANTILQDTKTIAVQGKDQYCLSLSLLSLRSP
jgi:hypothetical protein